jgi:DNA-binding transcriptional MerR regulator
MDKTWSLRELSAESGVPERTIRFYISRGLLDPPLKAGRGAVYGAGHKARLTHIRNLQAKGMMLSEIAHFIASERANRNLTLLKSRVDVASASEAGGNLPAPETWRSFRLSEDVIVMVHVQAVPWRTKRILSAMRGFSARINEKSLDPHKEDDDE